MRDCPLIAFGGLDTFTAEYFAANTAFDNEAEAVTHVWMRARVAELLSMTPSELVEWSIQRGNDFTGVYVDEKNTDGEAYQLAAQYSRAFYELEDLAVFYAMEVKDNAIEEEDDNNKPTRESVPDLEFETGGKLYPAQREFIAQWVKKNAKKLVRDEKHWSPRIIAAFFRDYQKRLPTVESNSNNNNSPSPSSSLFPLLKTHLPAFYDMRENLPRYKDILGRKRVLLTWDNVCAANAIQKIISTLAKCLSEYMDVSTVKVTQRFSLCRLIFLVSLLFVASLFLFFFGISVFYYYFLIIYFCLMLYCYCLTFIG